MPRRAARDRAARRRAPGPRPSIRGGGSRPSRRRRRASPRLPCPPGWLPRSPASRVRRASFFPGLLAAPAGSVIRRWSPMPTFRQLLDQARTVVPEVLPETLAARLRAADAPVLLDVREPDETAEGHLPDAILIPRGNLELRIERMVRRDREVVVYCASGVRSLLAARTLLDLGYPRVSSLAGGFGRW